MKKGYLIRYGELALKGKNRYMFENALVKHIKDAIKPFGDFEVAKEQGRIICEPMSQVDDTEVMNRIQMVFGIVGISPVYILEDASIENIRARAIQFVEEQYEDHNFTFKVESRRADKRYPLNSMEISRDVGGILLEHFEGLTVDVKTPSEIIRVEVRNKSYIFSRQIKGLGGMPVGTNGKAMLMLSGGIDSPVAGFMVAKRGVFNEAVYYHSHPYTSERAKQKVVDLAKILARYNGSFNLHVVPFTDIQLDIYERCPHEQLTIIMRRYMMIIAKRLARKRNCLALVTGESIGQVASQTIQSLAATNDVCGMPVFRPLIGLDKSEIVEISKKIETYETSILPYEDCCTIFVAKHPVTKPNLRSIEKSEMRLADTIEAMLDKAVEDTEVIHIEPDL